MVRAILMQADAPKMSCSQLHTLIKQGRERLPPSSQRIQARTRVADRNHPPKWCSHHFAEPFGAPS